MLPYLDGERTPDLPTATGSLTGLTRRNATPAHLARAAVEGMLCGLADGVDALLSQGVRLRRVLLIGGGRPVPGRPAGRGRPPRRSGRGADPGGVRRPGCRPPGSLGPGGP